MFRCLAWAAPQLQYSPTACGTSQIEVNPTQVREEMVHPVEHWLLSDLCPLIHRHCGFRCTVYAGLPGVLIKPNVPLDSKFTFMQCVCICLSKLLNRCEALLSENTYLHYLLFLILLTENRCDTLLTENLSQSGTTD